MFELVIIYTFPRETVVYEYATQADAEDVLEGMKIALGNQIEWSCIRPKLFLLKLGVFPAQFSFVETYSSAPCPVQVISAA